MRIVLDLNIFVSSFYWKGNPRKVFERVTNGLDELYITDEILKEIFTVMSRKKFDENNKILQCGIDGNVDFIITGDNDLLVLGEYMNIKIMKPKKYLENINE
jgi:predicted nucleic acid-binding protein